MKMKKYKKLVIGGIQSKVFNLILISVLLITIAYMLLALRHSKMLSNLVAESTQKQEESIADTTGRVMDQVVTMTLERSNAMEVKITDELFDSAKDRLDFLAAYAEDLFANADTIEPKPYSPPNPADDGKWKAKVIYADGVDPEDPALAAKLGLLANMEEMIIDACNTFDAANMYIALPEGAHYSISDTSSSWFVDGKIKSYDPRTRGWYQKAETEGKLVFTDGEWDANTGAYCIECAIPVYGKSGELLAVIGSDLYLSEMQQVLSESAIDGEYYLILNQSGHAVLEPQEASFPMLEEDKGGDLRESKNQDLADVVKSALQGETVAVHLGDLEDGTYYITARPIETTGWVLISAYNKESSGRAGVALQESLEGIQEESVGSYQEEIKRYRLLVLFVILGLMLLILGAATILGKRIVYPLNAMTKRISELGENDLTFKMEDTFRTGDEVEELAESFSALSQKTVEYMDEVVRVTAEKERIGAELSLANDIQTAMLPHIFPAFPNRSDFDVYASMDPAKEVGGDFYDYFLIDEDHLGLLIADVSGKGVPAELFMMASKIILQNVAMLGSSPKEVLEKTNEALCSNNEAEMFVTVWLGILELSTGKLTAANAGHEYPVVKHADGNFELYKDIHGFVIGGMEGMKYKEYEMILEPGAKVFLYTDGVPEATNANNELFGTDRMVDALNSDRDAAPENILKNVRQAVDLFVEEAEQFDDLTMLCLEYRGDTKIN